MHHVCYVFDRNVKARVGNILSDECVVFRRVRVTGPRDVNIHYLLYPFFQQQ